MSRHLAIVGATASGKSALALVLAREGIGGGRVELVSADSMQVYRGMDIGTAKPSAAERAEVRHHLIDVADPSEDYHVARFQGDVAAVLADIEARGSRAVLVGGTGLYVRAVVDALGVPASYPDIRARLEGEEDTAKLYDELAMADPAAATRMDAGNRRRVIRALEVTLGSGRRFSDHGPGLDVYGPPAIDVDLVGLAIPTDTLRARIADRVGAMLDAGWLAEVEALARRERPLSRTARQALGYRELLSHVEDGSPLADAVERTIHRTRQFARRQRVWFRRDPRIHWIDGTKTVDQLLPELRDWWTT